MRYQLNCFDYAVNSQKRGFACDIFLETYCDFLCFIITGFVFILVLDVLLLTKTITLIVHYSISISSMHYIPNCHSARDGNLGTQLQSLCRAVGADTILCTEDSIQVFCRMIPECPSSNRKGWMILHYSISSMNYIQN